MEIRRLLLLVAVLAPGYSCSASMFDDFAYAPAYQETQVSTEETASGASQPRAMRNIVFNGVVLEGRQLELLETLERYHQVGLPDQRYWYDRISGAFGIEGGAALALIQPDLDLGGPLRHDASGGRTGIFVNGRQLPASERDYLQQVVGGWIAPGRYWLLHDGTWGYEGGPAQGNLVAAARQNAPSQRESLLSGSFLTGTFVNASGAASRDGSSVTW